MQIKVRVNSAFSEVVEEIGEPEFYLVENLKVERLPDGRWSQQLGQNWHFGLEKWNDLVAANGDFSAIGINLKMDEVVPHFHEAYQTIRNQREPPP